MNQQHKSSLAIFCVFVALLGLTMIMMYSMFVFTYDSTYNTHRGKGVGREIISNRDKTPTITKHSQQNIKHLTYCRRLRNGRLIRRSKATSRCCMLRAWRIHNWVDWGVRSCLTLWLCGNHHTSTHGMWLDGGGGRGEASGTARVAFRWIRYTNSILLLLLGIAKAFV